MQGGPGDIAIDTQAGFVYAGDIEDNDVPEAP
jgi:hypothetical protein